MRNSLALPLIGFAVLLAACSDAGSPERLLSPEGGPALSSSADDAIPNQYIVVFKDGVTDVAATTNAKASRHSVAVLYRYGAAIKGFAARMTPAAAAELATESDVAYVEQDQVMRAFTTQSNATWGLDRIDQRALPLDGNYSYTSSGSGVTAYIIDTGIEISHPDFGGRASVGYDAVGDGQNGIDCNGHGTHVSGTTGGTTWGVAKSVKLVAVRVLSCSGSGTTSGVIAGVDWVTTNHATPAVANMSLGGGASTSLDDAVKRSIASGVAYAVAAGNGNQAGIAQDACKYSPARVPEAMTIGATDNTDTKTSWSNYGNCVDWFAPGKSITSAWLNGGTNTISGTSMATPHTAGVAALYLSLNPGASPQSVRDALYNNTTKNIVKSSKTTNNHLLFTNY